MTNCGRTANGPEHVRHSSFFRHSSLVIRHCQCCPLKHSPAQLSERRRSTYSSLVPRPRPSVAFPRSWNSESQEVHRACAIARAAGAFNWCRWPIYPTRSKSRKPATHLPPMPRLKACQQATHLNRWVLGEDSGLVVNALGGRAGRLFRSIFGRERHRRIEQPLAARSPARHAARSAARPIMFAMPCCPIQTARQRAEAIGECHGRILFAPAGTAGFGYDPLFEVIEYHRTFGTLGPESKACLSHRSRAIRQLLPHMQRTRRIRRLEVSPLRNS